MDIRPKCLWLIHKKRQIPTMTKEPDKEVCFQLYQLKWKEMNLKAEMKR